jgi:predicted Fe-Mo cluster-binding NifX family protein
MQIAIPLNDQLSLYHSNPCTAPKFAIYAIEGDRTHLSFRLTQIVDNPWCRIKCANFEEEAVACDCDPDRRNSMRHISEHYALLDAIGECSYLLADRYCENTKRAMKNGGVRIFKIPSIIKQTDMAIKNFLIGAELANTMQHIHHAS